MTGGARIPQRSYQKIDLEQEIRGRGKQKRYKGQETEGPGDREQGLDGRDLLKDECNTWAGMTGAESLKAGWD